MKSQHIIEYLGKEKAVQLMTEHFDEIKEMFEAQAAAILTVPGNNEKYIKGDPMYLLAACIHFLVRDGHTEAFLMRHCNE